MKRNSILKMLPLKMATLCRCQQMAAAFEADGSWNFSEATNFVRASQPSRRFEPEVQHVKLWIGTIRRLQKHAELTNAGVLGERVVTYVDVLGTVVDRISATKTDIYTRKFTASSWAHFKKFGPVYLEGKKDLPDVYGNPVFLSLFLIFRFDSRLTMHLFLMINAKQKKNLQNFRKNPSERVVKICFTSPWSVSLFIGSWWRIWCGFGAHTEERTGTG